MKITNSKNIVSKMKISTEWLNSVGKQAEDSANLKAVQLRLASLKKRKKNREK